MMNGKVTLVSAGPGDGGLLTLKAARAIGQAEVVLYDRLVGADILALIPPQAERIPVGKESGRHPVPQHEINALLVEKALAGRRVVRLKGGDAFLFGRGGEELEEVTARGIPFEVVPGVSASLAVPAYAGIPVTHRDYSSSVHILTGHAKAGCKPDIDYESLVRLGGTLVFMMGFTAMRDILQSLIAAGLDEATPAALIQNGTTPGQRSLVATAGTLYGRAMENGMAAPAVLIVGKVCALSPKLDWFSARPLSGRTAIVTRPVSAGSRLADLLEDAGCGVLRFPCIRMEARPEAEIPANLQDYDWIVFTSAFGASLFFDKLLEAGRDARSLGAARFAAIGERTAQALRERGVLADYVPDVFDAEHLAEGLVRLAPAARRMLLYRAAAGAESLPDILRRAGVRFDEIPAYDTLYESPAAEEVRARLAGGEIDWVTFTSASTVDGFVRAAGEDVVRAARFTAVCIGAQTAAKAERYGMQTATSAAATIDAMLDTMYRLADGGRA